MRPNPRLGTVAGIPVAMGCVAVRAPERDIEAVTADTGPAAGPDR